MQSRLIVKNFGPIKSVDLNLRNVNVFIGPQATGKSALAKIYTIFKAPRKFLRNTENDSLNDASRTVTLFENILEEYNIDSFINSNTEIEFDSELHHITYGDGRITYTPKLLKRIYQIEELKKNFQANEQELKEIILGLTRNFILISLSIRSLLSEKSTEELPKVRLEELDEFKNLSEETFEEIVDFIKELEIALSTHTALYIPAERSFINIVKNASLNLMHNNVPIPKHILSFGAELEKSTIKEIDLNFLQKGLVYKNINGEDRIFTNSSHSIKLSDSASGIQSAVPILIPILFGERTFNHRSFVIEEPELNLFPLAQYELIKLLESQRRESYWEDYGTIHTYTTHSPYILSAINNLLYAYKVSIKLMPKLKGKNSEKSEKVKRLVNSIVSAQINPNYFTAYQISDGMADSILDRESGLIIDNYIDDASDKLADDFEALTDLLNNIDEQ